MADSFAQAGFAVIAIDLPLHGVTDTANPFYQGPGEPVRQQRAALQSRQRRRHGRVRARRPDRQRLADLERRQPAERARSHPPSRRRHDRVSRGRLPGLNFPDGDREPRPRRQPHPLRRHLARQHHQRRVLGLEHRSQDRDAVEPGRPLDLDPHRPASDRLRRRRSARRSRRRACRPAPSASTTSSATCRRSSTPSIRSTTPPMPRATHPLHVIEVLGDTAVPNAPDRLHRAALGPAERAARRRPSPPPATVSGIVRFSAGRALVAVQSRDQPGRDRRDAAPDGALRRERAAASFRSPMRASCKLR